MNITKASGLAHLRRDPTYNLPPYPPVPPFKECPSSAKVPLAPVLKAKAVRPLPWTAFGDGDDGPMNVVLVWSSRLPTGPNSFADVKSYELYCCREDDASNDHSAWFKMMEVPAEPLPMRCEMAGFETGHTYYFIMRAIDVYDRRAPFDMINVSV